MAINFVTGKVRTGKTLMTLSRVKELAESSGRQVYTCNIPEINIPGWLEIDHPDQWMDLPNSCIIIIDELQDFWGKAGSNAAAVPLPILELSKHGKRGIDFWVITQSPGLVHPTVRALVTHHWHIVRAFGSHNVAVYRFDTVMADPEKVKAKGDKTYWRYPKQAFGTVDKKTGEVITRPWYKSADVHNIQRKTPWRIFVLVGAALLVPLLFYGTYLGGKYAYGLITHQNPAAATPATAAPAPGSRVPVNTGGATPIYPKMPGTSPPAAARVQTTREYLAARTPRLPDWPHTSPAYDSLTQPTDAPYPAACIKSATRCTCYTQQATVMATGKYMCEQIVAHGYFKDWRTAAPGQTGAPGLPGQTVQSGPPPAREASHLALSKKQAGTVTQADVVAQWAEPRTPPHSFGMQAHP